MSASAWKVLVRCTAIVGILIAAYAILPFQGDDPWVWAVVGFVALGAIVPFTARRARAVMASTHPAIDAGEAIVLLLAMLVLGFSAVYIAIDRNSGEFVGLQTRFDAVYFTVVTLSTVGFGDIYASGQAARIAVTFQILFDFTMVAIAVRVLVAAARRSLDNRRGTTTSGSDRLL